jgi:hypothetical protein
MRRYFVAVQFPAYSFHLVHLNELRTSTRLALFAPRERDISKALAGTVVPAERLCGTCFFTSIKFGPSGIAGAALCLFGGAGRTKEQRSWPANVELRKIWVKGADAELVYNKITVGGNY